MHRALAITSAAMSQQHDGITLKQQGLRHFANGDFSQACAAFEKLVEIAPADAPAHLGLARTRSGSIGLRTQFPSSPRHRASAGFDRCLCRTGDRSCAARDNWKRRWGLPKPRHKSAPGECRCRRHPANLLADLRREGKALGAVRRGGRQESTRRMADFGRGRVLLLLGRLDEGFRELEWRFLHGRHAPQYPQPRWDGSSDIAGRTILVRSEQGLGDTIQLMRYVPLLAERGAKVFVQCQPTLVELMMSLQGVSLVRPIEPRLPQYDVWTPAMSLPHCFRTTLETLPNEVPYLKPDQRRIVKCKDLFAKTAHSGRH